MANRYHHLYQMGIAHYGGDAQLVHAAAIQGIHLQTLQIDNVGH